MKLDTTDRRGLGPINCIYDFNLLRARHLGSLSCLSDTHILYGTLDQASRQYLFNRGRHLSSKGALQSNSLIGCSVNQ